MGRGSGDILAGSLKAGFEASFVAGLLHLKALVEVEKVHREYLENKVSRQNIANQ
jgi:hypothetical protein